MLYDLTEYTPKINKKKVIITVIIAISIILIVTLIVLFKIKDHKKIAQEQNSLENQIINDQKVIANEPIQNENVQEHTKQKHIAKVSFLPVYSEESVTRMHNIYNGEEKIAYLTFDDGPSKTVTPLILDLLKQEDIKATFFVLGSRVELNPSLVKREYEEGHFIANHGYSHNYASIYSSTQAVLDEYNKAQASIKNAIGNEYDGHLFRFPGGSTGGRYRVLKAEAKNVLAQNGISYIDWNALSNDAAGAKTKEALLDNIKKTVENKNKVVILMHDAGDKILTYETLPDVINYLREQGYSFKSFYNIMK